MDTVRDLIALVLARKKYWLVPILFFALVLGVLFVVSSGSAIAPFIYTLF